MLQTGKTMLQTGIDSHFSAPRHHIPAELLLDYAVGRLAEPWSLVVACHLSLCPECRDEMRRLEALGGAALDRAEVQPLRRPMPATLPPRQNAAKAETAAAVAGRDTRLPAPLRKYLPDGLDQARWRWVGSGLRSLPLPVASKSGGMVSLLKIAPGQGMPVHSHGGEEMTLVLCGGFSDERGEFRRGDVEIADDGVEHQPVAMPDEPCICLAVTDAPLRFAGRFGWIFNQWARFTA
ncbi:ChrR family anti-sigma-E factor [Ferrovibrio sp.]|uniref:ChrR family anti-sigma-E factor n=1 Tax=Ferrovibrio sp. TaxID=1917215 RepID=UPI0025C3DCEB|nr:ChrR family anti-sigma-E factor [Ferrovibrio sp.]